jgi:hypothetical protein
MLEGKDFVILSEGEVELIYKVLRKQCVIDQGEVSVLLEIVSRMERFLHKQ